MGVAKPRRKLSCLHGGHISGVPSNSRVRCSPNKYFAQTRAQLKWSKCKSHGFCRPNSVQNGGITSGFHPFLIPSQSPKESYCSYHSNTHDHLMAHAIADVHIRPQGTTPSRTEDVLPPLLASTVNRESSQLPLYYTNTRGRELKTPAVVSSEKLYVLGIPLHKLSRPVQFSICVSGVMVFYLLYGYAQEWIFNVEGFKPFGWYLTLVQFIFYSVFGSMERSLRGERTRRVPLKTYMFLAFLTVSTMGLSNTSLGYLNYPTQVIFKSCKLIPVMFGGILIQGKKYTILDGVSLLCMSIGLIMFTLADSSVQPNFDMTGVLLISLALCADAVIGNVQEKTLKQYSASNVELVLYSYFVGVFYILLGVLLSGSLIPAFQFCLKNPKMYFMAAIFSLTGYLGINFVLVLVRSFGALLAVTVTTFRKAVTMVLSFLVFTKPFTSQYVWSGFIVLLAIALNVYSKNRSKVDSYIGVCLLQMKVRFHRKRKQYPLFEV